MNLDRLSLQRRLVVSFSVLSVLLLISNLFSVFQLKRVRDFSAEIAEVWLPSVTKAGELNANATRFRMIEAESLLSKDAAKKKLHDEHMEKASQNVFIYKKSFEELIKSEEQQKLFDEFSDNWEKYQAEHDQIVEALSKEDSARAIQLLQGNASELFLVSTAGIEKLSNYSYEKGVEASAIASKVYKQSLILMGIATLVGVLACVLSAMLISRRIAGALERILRQIRSVAGQVNGHSTTLSATSQGLSSSSTEAAAALQETMSAIEEVSAMVARNSQNAGQSREMAQASKESAMQGKAEVTAILESINEIDRGNQRMVEQVRDTTAQVEGLVKLINNIADKTQIINDIVFQTKLLSFNASVEAARAGEQGKGFAVVAEEVGNLARMSGTAAKEISDMLASSTQQVQQMVESSRTKTDSSVREVTDKVQLSIEKARKGAATFDVILDNVSKASDMVDEIANASAEQARGVQEISKAMQQLDLVIQQNSSSAGESSAMAATLTDQAGHLASSVQSLQEVIDGKKDAQAVAAEETSSVLHTEASSGA